MLLSQQCPLAAGYTIGFRLNVRLQPADALSGTATPRSGTQENATAGNIGEKSLFPSVS